jgi:hypothetical protein
MKKSCTVSLAILALGLFAGIANAELLYEQTFNPSNDPNGYVGAIGDSGWVVDAPTGWYSGTYSGNFAPLNMLADAATMQPINGNTGVYIGFGGPLTAALGMFYTTDGQGGFTTIDPASSDRLLLTVYANTQAGGADDLGYFAVQVGDGDPRTDDELWYISSTPMAVPAQNQGNLLDLRSLEYNPAAGNWNSLTLATPAIGGPAGDLSGLLITGVGIVQSLSNPTGDFSSWNYADFRILNVPEPATIALVMVAAAACFVRRSRKR